MEPVTMYKANDGSFFDSPHKAKKHEALLEMAIWYEENKLYGYTVGCRIEFEELIEWCKDNRKNLLKIMNLI